MKGIFAIALGIATLGAVALEMGPASAQQTGPSYDCSGSGLDQSELTICFNPELARLDRQLAAAFDAYVDEHGPSEVQAMRAGQNAWLKERDACGADVGCLENEYRQRIALLQNVQSRPQPAPTFTGFPAPGFSWGGVIRSGPSMDYDRVGTVAEGTPLTLLANTGQSMNGYDWFQVRLPNGLVGYQWGGIICGEVMEIPGTFRTCTAGQFN